MRPECRSRLTIFRKNTCARSSPLSVSTILKSSAPRGSLSGLNSGGRQSALRSPPYRPPWRSPPAAVLEQRALGNPRLRLEPRGDQPADDCRTDQLANPAERQAGGRIERQCGESG